MTSEPDSGTDDRSTPVRRYLAFWGTGVLVVGATMLLVGLASRD